MTAYDNFYYLSIGFATLWKLFSQRSVWPEIAELVMETYDTTSCLIKQTYYLYNGKQTKMENFIFFINKIFRFLIILPQV